MPRDAMQRIIIFDIRIVQWTRTRKLLEGRKVERLNGFFQLF